MTTYTEKLEELQRLRAEVRRLERAAENEAKRMQPLTEADERHMTDMQARADEAYSAAGRRAPPPLPLERPDEYRRRLVDGVKGYSPRWREHDRIHELRDDALEVVESQIFADAVENGRTHGLMARQIRPMKSRTDAGHAAVDYVGGPEASFVRQFERPARRAVFKTHEEYNAMTRTATMQQITNAYHRPAMAAPRAAF